MLCHNKRRQIKTQADKNTDAYTRDIDNNMDAEEIEKQIREQVYSGAYNEAICRDNLIKIIAEQQGRIDSLEEQVAMIRGLLAI